MLTETLTDATDAMRDRLRDLASEGLDRSPDITESAKGAIDTARTWADDITDDTVAWLSEEDHRRDAGTWLATAAAVAVGAIAAIWFVRWLRDRRRRRRRRALADEVRTTLEENAPGPHGRTSRIAGRSRAAS